jgi:outer membrane protein assembly factor BamB
MSYDKDYGFLYVFGEVSPVWSRRGTDPFSIALSRPVGSVEHGVYAAIDIRTDRVVWRKESPWGMSGGSGALSTAGGLLFHMEGDGNVQADDARTGKTLWRFQTGALPVPGPMGLTGGVPGAAYEGGGVEYVAFVAGSTLWAFSLRGSLPPREAPPEPPRTVGFSGIVRTLPDDGSGEITLGRSDSMVQTAGAASTEDGITPLRCRVKAGVRFRWMNRGTSAHSVAAADGSWRTPAIPPGESLTFRVDKSGTYAFSIAESPWSKAQLIVR